MTRFIKSQATLKKSSLGRTSTKITIEKILEFFILKFFYKAAHLQGQSQRKSQGNMYQHHENKLDCTFISLALMKVTT